MARTDNLTHFLTDVSSAIKNKKGDSTPIAASNFDTEIANLPSGGSDPSEYFNLTGKIPAVGSNSAHTSITSFRTFPPAGTLRKIPEIKIEVMTGSNGCAYVFSGYPYLEEINLNGLTWASGAVYRMKGLFYQCPELRIVDMSEINITGDVSQSTANNNISNAFKGCSKLGEVHLNKLSGTFDVGELFSGCTNLEFIDIRSLDIANCVNVSTSTTSFLGSSRDGQVPFDCEIVVADNTQKAFMNTTFPSYTNVKTVAEL